MLKAQPDWAQLPGVVHWMAALCPPVVAGAVELATVARWQEARSMEARYDGGTKYPLEGRTVVLFTLDKHRGHRRASDAEEELADDRMALQVTR